MNLTRCLRPACGTACTRVSCMPGEGGQGFPPSQLNAGKQPTNSEHTGCEQAATGKSKELMLA